jgi:hypothetical protein
MHDALQMPLLACLGGWCLNDLSVIFDIFFALIFSWRHGAPMMLMLLAITTCSTLSHLLMHRRYCSSLSYSTDY